MPKFLDVPSWYNSQGTLSYGVGVDTNERPGVGDVPCVHLPSGELNWRSLMVNGAQSGDINIYAPTLKGDTDEYLYWTSGGSIRSRKINIDRGTESISSQHEIYTNSTINDTVITITSGKYIHNVVVSHTASQTALYFAPYVTSSSAKVTTFSSLLNSVRSDGNNGYLAATGTYNGNIVYAFGSTGLSGFIYYITII